MFHHSDYPTFLAMRCMEERSLTEACDEMIAGSKAPTIHEEIIGRIYVLDAPLQ
jgi:hypothetical protein